MGIHIETERLYIRELLPTDDIGMFEMDADPEVHRYINNKPLKTIDESRDVIAFIRQQYVDNGIGRWAVIEKATDGFVGWIGFKLMRERINKHINFYDFGYRLMQKHWNKGFASEAGKASLDYGIEKLALKDIYAMTDIDNGASRHVLEKLGFRLVEIFKYDGQPTWRNNEEPATWYKLFDERMI